MYELKSNANIGNKCLKDISFLMLSPRSSCLIFSLSNILIATSSPVSELVAYFTLDEKIDNIKICYAY